MLSDRAQPGRVLIEVTKTMRNGDIIHSQFEMWVRFREA
jgi:hypothetical protein